MKRLKICFLCLCVVCGLYAKDENIKIDLTLQPFTGTEIFVDGKKVNYTIASSDNTLAQIYFNLKKHEDGNEFSVLKKGFVEKKITIPPTDKQSYSFVAILDKADSKCKFQKLFLSDGTPKSVRFIDNNKIVVTLLSGKGINIIDLNTGKKLLVSPPEKYAKQKGFVESLILKHKKELWISQMTTACIHVFSLPNFEYKTSIQSSGKWGKVMAYSKKHNRVYFSNWITQDISIINPDTYKEERRVNAGAVPRGMSFSNDENFIYLAQFSTPNGQSRGKVRKVSLENFKTVASFGTPGAKRHIVKDYKRKLLYVSDMCNSTIEVFFMDSNKTLATINVYDNPNTICLTPVGDELLVSCRGPNNPNKGYLYKGYQMGRIYIIDTKTFKVKEWIEGGNQPTGLDISPDGKTIAFSDFLDNRIRIYRREDFVQADKKNCHENYHDSFIK